MSARKQTILIVEDCESLAAVYTSYLEQNPDYKLTHVLTGRDAMIRLHNSPPDLLLLDLNLPDMNGMDILKFIFEQKLPSEVIIITAHGSVDLAVDALHLGAFDFLVKPFDAKRLRVTVKNALEHFKLSQQLEHYRETFDRTHYEGFIGESMAMQAIYRTIDSAASSQATIFITGESGTGKEVCALAIHQRSTRKDKPFIALNCGAIPKDLIESEIFGHVKGAFTGAVSLREGAAQMANGGTLFLDEICEMDIDLQTKLLRFIQTGTFRKVGSSTTDQVNVRFVCATNRDPWEEVQKGNFREDLFYRLHVIPIHLPPLRERETDVLLLMECFLLQYSKEESHQFKRFNAAAKTCMLNYPWPGNVRQLQNVIRQIVVLNDNIEVSLDMIPMNVRQAAGQVVTPAEPKVSLLAKEPQAESDIEPLWKVEKETIERAIALCDGNIPKAAALLEVSASTIYRKKERW